MGLECGSSRLRLVPHHRLPLQLRAVTSPGVTTRQVWFQMYEGLSPFRAKKKEERPGFTHFHFGPYLTEWPFLSLHEFEMGLFDPGGNRAHSWPFRAETNEPCGVAFSFELSEAT